MTVKDYILSNKGKSAYTIRCNKKNYLTTETEAIKYFGSRNVLKVKSKFNNDNLPILCIE